MIVIVNWNSHVLINNWDLFLINIKCFKKLKANCQKLKA
jgi:hypothetical protein